MFNNDGNYDVSLNVVKFLDAYSLARFAGCNRLTRATTQERTIWEESSSFAGTRFARIMQHHIPTQTTLPIRPGRIIGLHVHRQWLLVSTEDPRQIRVYKHTETPIRQTAQVDDLMIANVCDGHMLCMPTAAQPSILDLYVLSLETGKAQRLPHAQGYGNGFTSPKFIPRQRVATQSLENQISIFNQSDGTLVAQRSGLPVGAFTHWRNILLTVEASNIVAWNIDEPPANASVIVSHSSMPSMVVNNDAMFSCVKTENVVTITDLYTRASRRVVLGSGPFCTKVREHCTSLMPLDEHHVLAWTSSLDFRRSPLSNVSSPWRGYVLTINSSTAHLSPIPPRRGNMPKVYPLECRIVHDIYKNTIVDLFNGVTFSSPGRADRMALALSSSKVFILRENEIHEFVYSDIVPPTQLTRKQRIKLIARRALHHKVVRISATVAAAAMLTYLSL